MSFLNFASSKVSDLRIFPLIFCPFLPCINFFFSVAQFIFCYLLLSPHTCFTKCIFDCSIYTVVLILNVPIIFPFVAHSFSRIISCTFHPYFIFWYYYLTCGLLLLFSKVFVSCSRWYSYWLIRPIL